MGDYKNTNWWKYLDEPMRDLMEQSHILLEQETRLPAGQGMRAGEFKYHDYSFVVFPMAKAFEGFLKKLFLDMGLISRGQYTGEHFRIGKALNPNLPKRYRSGWVFGKLVAACNGDQILPLSMWETWKKARNRIFHFFPDHQEFISLVEARGLVEGIEEVMERAMEGCKIRFG